MVGNDGGVFAFGDAGFVGSLPGLKVHVNNIVGVVPTSDDQGYWMVGDPTAGSSPSGTPPSWVRSPTWVFGSATSSLSPASRRPVMRATLASQRGLAGY